MDDEYFGASKKEIDEYMEKISIYENSIVDQEDSDLIESIEEHADCLQMSAVGCVVNCMKKIYNKKKINKTVYIGNNILFFPHCMFIVNFDHITIQIHFVDTKNEIPVFIFGMLNLNGNVYYNSGVDDEYHEWTSFENEIEGFMKSISKYISS